MSIAEKIHIVSSDKPNETSFSKITAIKLTGANVGFNVGLIVGENV